MGFHLDNNKKNEEYFYSGILDNPVIAKEGIKGNCHPILERQEYVHVDPLECALVVSNKKVLEYCAKPGTYQYESYTSFSCFSDEEECKNTFNELKPIFSLDWNKKEKRLYYFNLRELNVNTYKLDKFPIHIELKNYFIDMDLNVYLHAHFSYHIVNPILFYLNVCGDFEEIFIGTEFENALRENLNKTLIVLFAQDLEKSLEFVQNEDFNLFFFMKEKVNSIWKENMGIELTSFDLDDKEIENIELFKKYLKQAKKDEKMQEFNLLLKKGYWKCSCGKINNSNFCRDCGKPKPIENKKYELIEMNE